MGFFRLFVSYIKINENTGELYAGKTSGLTKEDSSEETERIMNERDSCLHKNKGVMWQWKKCNRSEKE